MSKGSVLSIDDDDNLQMVLQHYLEGDGYEVILVSNIADALQCVASTKLDVILLDLMLHNEEGIDFIPKLKVQSDAPIIVVSGKSDTTEKIVCLEMGADDYITKPFEMRELVARIKAVRRRVHDIENVPSTDFQNEKVGFLGWCLDRAQCQLFDEQGRSANLTIGEFKLLNALVNAPARALSREHLFSLIRGEEYDIYDRAIDVQIARLRKKLGSDGELIKTMRGVGYMFSEKTHVI